MYISKAGFKCQGVNNHYFVLFSSLIIGALICFFVLESIDIFSQKNTEILHLTTELLSVFVFSSVVLRRCFLKV